jgi:acyl-CoA synthetase (AMP-forming)/AMP-acid ligase II
MYSLLQDIGIKQNLFESVHYYKGKKFEETITNFNSIIYYLKINASKHPRVPFIIEVLNGIETQIITYQNFYQTLLKIAYILKNTYNLKKGSKIAILPENNIISIYMILGTMICGGTAVIINPNEPLNRILQQIKKVGCSVIIIDAINLRSGINYTVSAQDILEQSKSLVNLPDFNMEFNFQYHTPALIIFTTGTTSTSKPVVQMHYNIAINCYALVKHYGLRSKQRLLCTLPIYHANGLEFTIFSSMIAGSTVILCDGFNPLTYLQLIEQYKVNIASLVPTNLDCLNKNQNNLDLSSLKYFVSAASPLSSRSSNFIWNKFHKRIIQGYGLTETTNFSTLLPVNLVEDDYQSLMLNCDIPSVGQAILGNEVVILKGDGTIASDEEEGEICMRGHNIMAGYLYNSTANRDCFKNGWFHSGDIGKFVSLLSSKERFLKITGRIKNIVKISGHAVSLDEIDRIISNIKGVDDVVTCAVDDLSFGEIPISFIVNNDNSLMKTDIIDVLAKSLGYQNLPRKIIFTSSIPRMKNGKVNRADMVKNYFQFTL